MSADISKAMNNCHLYIFQHVHTTPKVSHKGLSFDRSHTNVLLFAAYPQWQLNVMPKDKTDQVEMRFETRTFKSLEKHTFSPELQLKHHVICIWPQFFLNVYQCKLTLLVLTPLAFINCFLEAHDTILNKHLSCLVFLQNPPRCF